MKFNMYSLQQLRSSLEDLPDPSAFTIRPIAPPRGDVQPKDPSKKEELYFYKMFPVYLIGDIWWPVESYEIQKHHPEFFEINIAPLGYTMMIPKVDRMPTILTCTFIEDHYRSVEAAYSTWLKYSNMDVNASLMNNDPNIASIHAIDIIIETFDATRDNIVKTESLSILPPCSPLTLIGDQGEKGTIKYKIDFPILAYKCEFAV